MLIFCDFIQVYVFTTNHHLNLGLLMTICGFIISILGLREKIYLNLGYNFKT